MKLLADENFPRPTVDALRAGGHDVIWARTSMPGVGDRAVLDSAEADGRIVLTLDKVSLTAAALRLNVFMKLHVR